MRRSPLLSPEAWITSATEDTTMLHTLRCHCLLYTSDAADERSSVDLGGRRIIKKKKKRRRRHGAPTQTYKQYVY